MEISWDAGQLETFITNWIKTSLTCLFCLALQRLQGSSDTRYTRRCGYGDFCMPGFPSIIKSHSGASEMNSHQHRQRFWRESGLWVLHSKSWVRISRFCNLSLLWNLADTASVKFISISTDPSKVKELKPKKRSPVSKYQPHDVTSSTCLSGRRDFKLEDITYWKDISGMFKIGPLPTENENILH